MKCEQKYDTLGKIPNCERCEKDFKRVELDIHNYITMDIWGLVYNQTITSFNGAVDINLSTVLDISGLYDISNDYKLEIIKAISKTWNHFNDINKEKENLRKKNDKRMPVL